MKKLLYITDQQEYTEHGTIGPLFNGYLRKHMDVTIVYFTRYKHSFQRKGDNLIVPEKKRHEIVEYLERKGSGLGQYDVVMVRNMTDILRQVLKAKSRLGYKVGYRISIPRTVESYERLKARYKTAFFASMRLKWQLARKQGLINRCDLFLPSSRSMAAAFYRNVTTKVHPLPSGIDPAKLCRHHSADSNVRRFIYVGTLDPLRRFEVVLDALDKIDTNTWHLDVSTFDPDFFNAQLAHYRRLQNNITVMRAENLQTLRQQISHADVGLALLPPLPLYATSIAAKVLDYYACGIPALLSENQKNRMIFPDDSVAFYAPFETEAIRAKLEMLIAMPREAIETVAQNGLQNVLAKNRGYDRMAEKLAETLEKL